MQVILCSRREGDQSTVERLYRVLRASFSSEQVVKGVANIPVGSDVRAEIDKTIADSIAMVLVIGPDWGSRDSHGRRRIDQTNDLVRMETRQALAVEMRVFPVLVDASLLPSPEELPEDISGLGFLSPLHLLNESWHRDIQILISAIDDQLAESERHAEASFQIETTRNTEVEAHRQAESECSAHRGSEAKSERQARPRGETEALRQSKLAAQFHHEHVVPAAANRSLQPIDAEQASRLLVRPRVLPSSIFGWVASTVALMNLASNAGFLRLGSDIALWLESYNEAVGKIGHLLFGWLNFLWLGVSDAELDLLVLFAIVGATALRVASQRVILNADTTIDGLWDIFYGLTSSRAVLGNFGPFYIYPTAIAILVPDPIGWIWLLGIFLPVLLFNLLYFEQENLFDKLRSRFDLSGDSAALLVMLFGYSGSGFRTNLLMVVGLFLLVILADSFISQATLFGFQ